MLLFSIVIFTPAIIKLCNITTFLTGVNENRTLQRAPHFKELTLAQYTRTWDKYFNDRLGLRDLYLPLYIRIWEARLHAPVSEYVTGRNGELFMNHAAPVVSASLGLLPWSPQSRAELRVGYAAKHAYFYAQGIPFYVFLVPDKSTVYPELMPFYASMIPHDGWYKTQLSELQNARINVTSLKEYFDEYSHKMRLYDRLYDNCHWNGNALYLAYPYMAKVLARDNSIFEPVSKDYYEIYDADVGFQPYGNDHTQFIRLKHQEDLICKEADPDLQTVHYNKTCVNQKKASGSLLFFSDSYFGSTHGSGAIPPFVFNVKVYNHRHYALKKGDNFKDFIERNLAKDRPDAVIEEFVERMRGGSNGLYYDPYMRILGNTWLKTGGFTIDHSLPEEDYRLINCRRLTDTSDKNNTADGLIIDATSSDPIIEFIRTVKADDLGRVALMMNISAPADTVAQIYFADPAESFNKGKVINITLHQGDNLIAQELWFAPYQEVRLRFDPGTVPGRYIFKRIPQLDELRARMKENGI